ncbi:MAG: L-histidine N(alpha)-methyltransferase [Deltaproteobacteria bacterium]|nr:L-histidine N(alpha)-methyltransferase [Deltaproteobacteria bacterium]
MKKPSQPPSQAIDLFLTVAEALGVTSDREVAALADVVADNVPNWRTGHVREFKVQTLEAIKASLVARVQALAREADRSREAVKSGLQPLVIESGSAPDDLHKEFRERVAFDYLGHRFLYYEPQGALAWRNLIRAGYDQDAWLAGTRAAARDWLQRSKDNAGRLKGPIAHALALDRRVTPKGLDVVALGCGDGSKEAVILRELAEAGGELIDGMAYVPVDVSIPLLLEAANAGREVVHARVQPVCADFEEGPLTFASGLPSAMRPPDRALRLVLLLGNTFGNLRDEDAFVRHKLSRLVRSGDLVWLEVALRVEPLSDDPLMRMVEQKQAETAAEANRRLLIEGPFRRWEAAAGRPPARVDLRVIVRQDDDASRVPGSCNFCHDLLMADERRACTMLFSRRYALDGLTAWLEERDLAVERVQTVRDARRRPRVAHLLLRRR